MKLNFRHGLIAVLVAAPLASCAAHGSQGLTEQAQKHFQPIKAATTASSDKVELGRQLFFEPRLSRSGAISCNSCHNLSTYGADNLPTSFGHDAQRGGRNSPTVLNAGLHVAQFWDGRAKDLTEQAKGPILNPVEMAMPDEGAVVARLKTIPGYVAGFKKAFPEDAEPVSYQNMAVAIAAFESTLVTPSRFDRFLEGDQTALTATERKGLKTFMDKGCVSCHSGPALGGNQYMRFGIAKPYANTEDLGRFELTKVESDKHVFKVPSLRNIDRTYPYFHDGGVWKLDEAVQVMGETQLGVTLTKEENAEIVAFLGSLTGDLKPDARKLPVLPANGPDTVL